MPTIDLPITYTLPGVPVEGTVTVEFDEVKLVEGYHTRKITRVVFPAAFPRDQQESYMKSIYHSLNRERQKVVLDDARAKS